MHNIVQQIRVHFSLKKEVVVFARNETIFLDVKYSINDKDY